MGIYVVIGLILAATHAGVYVLGRKGSAKAFSDLHTAIGEVKATVQNLVAKK